MGSDRPGTALATVILPTFRRPAQLRILLESLAGQASPIPWELVVVDNDPDRSAAPIVDAARPAFGVPVRYVAEPASGAAHARNRGIAEAAGDLLVMIDDDVVAEPAWLSELVEPVVAGRCDGTGGRVILDPSVARPRWFDEVGIGGLLTYFDLGDEERPLANFEYIVTASACFRADLLRRTIGFDPAYGPRGRVHLTGDDVQVLRAFQAQGGVVHYVPAAVVIHELPASRLNVKFLTRRSYYQGRSDHLIDREALLKRRYRGAGAHLRWLHGEVKNRVAEGLTQPQVAFHLWCDVVRAFGALKELTYQMSRKPTNSAR